MILRLTALRACLLLIAALGTASLTNAQTVRFDTSLGSFDIELLPDFAPLNVANFLSYVTTGRYDNVVINRAEGDFAVQTGSFSSVSATPPADVSGFTNIIADPDVIGEPAATTGLSNTVGTVALANSGPPDTGSSSFFINGSDNSNLDSTFTVFGRVTDMTVVNAIFDAPKFLDATNRYSNSFVYSDMPLQPNGDLVLINSARVLSSTIPEPSTMLLTLVGVSAGILFRRRQ